MLTIILVTLFFGGWNSKESIDPLTDEEKQILWVKSESGNQSLYITCKNREDLDFYINWGEFLSSEALEVTYRFDKGEAKKNKWEISTDGTATFHTTDYVGTEKKPEFYANLLKSEKFIARVAPHFGNPITAVFIISGLEPLVAKWQGACQFFNPPPAKLITPILADWGSKKASELSAMFSNEKYGWENVRVHDFRGQTMFISFESNFAMPTLQETHDWLMEAGIYMPKGSTKVQQNLPPNFKEIEIIPYSVHSGLIDYPLRGKLPEIGEDEKVWSLRMSFNWSLK